MTRRRTAATKSAVGCLKETNRSDKPVDRPDALVETKVDGIEGIKSLLDNDENNEPRPSTSSRAETFITGASALYNELDTFRQKWKRELEVSKTSSNLDQIDSNASNYDKLSSCNEALKESFSATNNSHGDSKQIYALAKKLFLKGVELEQKELQYESIRYYKQAVHLYPDIEKQIFREQCETSAREVRDTEKPVLLQQKAGNRGERLTESDDDTKAPLVERIYSNLCDGMKENEQFLFCKPAYKLKPSTLHISILPKELILQIFKSVIGPELDLRSLETLGQVCRNFYLLSRDQSLWRTICHQTWGNAINDLTGQVSACEDKAIESDSKPSIDWRQVYLMRPRVNFDGVYMSRTRYIRVGDAGFQDLTYRPFHIVRYYRYLRFFPDRRVLILTTNEEPERIVPIFRHALDAKHFSSELSILEGSYEYEDSHQVNITAEKDFRSLAPTNLQRRQQKFQCSRQTPLTQKFSLKFELKTSESRPHRNNLLKWLEYTILTKMETGQELTTFDLSSDSFPSLQFDRVKRSI